MQTTTGNTMDTNSNLVDPRTLPLNTNWVLYIYNKSAFRKLTYSDNVHVKPYREICRITNVAELMYIVNLMGDRADVRGLTKNLDKNDYIIMREGIEPIWEDPRNMNGGTFSAKIDHQNGYDLWRQFVLYIMGETFCKRMNSINGISVSYIKNSGMMPNIPVHNIIKGGSDQKEYTYIKVWCGEPGLDLNDFKNLMPATLTNQMENCSLMYMPNQGKKDFNKEDIVQKLKKTKMTRVETRDEEGFITIRKGRK